jgi:general secretion pathway protein D
MKSAALQKRIAILPFLIFLICASSQQLLSQDDFSQQVSAKGVAMERQLLEAQLREEAGLRLEADKITKETKERQKLLTEQEKKQIEALAAQTAQEEQAFLAEQRRASMRNKERQEFLAAQELKRHQDLQTKQEELAREIKEKRNQIAIEETRRLQEIRMKQEELARQIEERQKRIADREAGRLAELRKKEAELARLREANLKKIAEERARRQLKLEKLEKERQARETRLQQRLQAKKEKEEKAREEARRREQQRQEEIARRQELKRQRLAEAQRKRVEAQAKREWEQRLQEERLAKAREEKEKKLAEQKMRREQKLKEKQQQLALEKALREKQLAAQKARREQELKEKEEKLAREKALREKQLAAQKMRDYKERQMDQAQDTKEREKLERQKQLAQLKMRQEELAREKDKLQKKTALADEKSKQQFMTQREIGAQTRQMLKLLEDEKRLRKRAELKARREEALRIRQERLAAKKLKKAEQLVALRAKQQKEKKLKSLRLAKVKKEIEKKKRVEAEKAKQASQTLQVAKAERQRAQEVAKVQSPQTVPLARPKLQPLTQVSKAQKAPSGGAQRAGIQERAMSEAKSTKHKEDAEKIKRADELWVRARKLYGMGQYEQAIKDFQEIIVIEGNPRIKYTPAAKDYINKANVKLKEQNKLDQEKKIENKDQEMLDAVVSRQLLPYVEPPSTFEETKEIALFETPHLRKQLTEKKISMDFDQLDLKSVISFLSQESGINFVASQKVLEMALKVTARFDQTPIYEVVKYVTKSQGLLYRIDKEVVWIAHPEEIAQESLETRVYYLSKGGGLFTEFSGTAGGTTESGLGSSSAQITKIYTIEDTLKEVVSWPQDAKMTFDKRINALIVRNTPQNLQMLEDMLYNLDITPLQILIEAKFLEVDVTDTKELGLEWKFANEDFAVENKKGGNFAHGLAQNSGVDFSTFSRASEGLNLTYKGVLTSPQFEAILHALDETKKIKTLSSPRITTLNNQLATIKVVDEWIYPTRYDYEIVQFDLNGDGDFNDAGETTYKNVPKDFIRRDVGILLRVIPSIGADKKTISLSLIPEVSEATADYFSYTGDVKLPKFTSRNLSTTVVVNSGDTVVLGGLIKENRTKITTKVPLLADLPFLGALFRKDTDSIQRKNLIIFVTAKMLTPSGEEVVVANAQ